MHGIKEKIKKEEEMGVVVAGGRYNHIIYTVQIQLFLLLWIRIIFLIVSFVR